MKKILTAFFLVLGMSAYGQSGYTVMNVSGGVSSSKGKLLSLSFHKWGNKPSLGILAESLFFTHASGKDSSKKLSDKAYLAAGLYIRHTLSSTRNFSTEARLGAAAGTYQSRFVWYPFAGLEQSFYWGGRTSFFIAERVLYLMEKRPDKRWHPNVNAGIQFFL